MSEYCQDEYTWFFKSNKNFRTNKTIFYDDSVGISSDGEQLIHDAMVYGLTKYKKIEKVENVGLNTAKITYLLFKFAGNSPNLFYNEKIIV